MCTLGLEDCTDCSYGCTESKLFLDEFNVDKAVHGGAFSEKLLLTQVEDDEQLMKVWNALDADKHKEFRSRLFDELSRWVCSVL